MCKGLVSVSLVGVRRLIQQAELDVRIGDDAFAVRVEILRVGSKEPRYAARFWRAEHFRLPPTFPQDGRGQPVHDSSDELILVDWSHHVVGNWSDFVASTEERALEQAVRAVKEGVARITGIAIPRRRRARAQPGLKPPPRSTGR